MAYKPANPNESTEGYVEISIYAYEHDTPLSACEIKYGIR